GSARRRENWHPIVTAAVEHLEACTGKLPTQVALSGRLGVGVDRLRDLFGRDVGMDINVFFEWYRLGRFATLAAQSPSWRVAAHAVGYRLAEQLLSVVIRSFGFAEEDLANGRAWRPLDGSHP